MTHTECAVQSLHEEIWKTCITHQRSIAKNHGKQKAHTLQAIRTIEKKLAGGSVEELVATTRNLERYKPNSKCT